MFLVASDPPEVVVSVIQLDPHRSRLSLVFAGFCGMLERFRPGAFASAADAGIGDWIAFSFFSALAQDYTGITPVSVAAGVLVGARLVLSVGWALVVFAAVMSAIQPQLDRIARRNASTDAD